MTVRPLNLLRHPRPAHLLEPALQRLALACVLAGGLAGMGWGVWQQHRQDDWLARRSALKAQAQSQASQQVQIKASEQREQMLKRQAARQQAWQTRRQHMLALHAVLSAQARNNGLRVLRWQGDGRQLVLQLWLPHAQALPSLTAQLSQAWPLAWTLQSLNDQAGAGIEAVLEAPWPIPPRDGGGKQP